MNYQYYTCDLLRHECKRRGIINLSKKNKKDLIFTLKCDDTLKLKESLREPGCSWERVMELYPSIKDVLSTENLYMHLYEIEKIMKKKKRKEKRNIVYKYLQCDCDCDEEDVPKINKVSTFSLDTNKHYQEINIETLNLEKLIELAKEYTPEIKDKYAFDYEKLHAILPYLEELQSYIGWDSVKDHIVNIVIPVLVQLHDDKSMMHTVIQGSPGVGKTTLGSLLSKIYSKLGLIDDFNGNFKIFKRSDLIGEYLGQTAVKTQKAIDSCLGGVMFIDEAYSIGASGRDESSGSYARECIDTINQNLTEKAGQFICIIAGYEDLLQNNFFALNHGLERRFPIKFTIQKYNPNELTKIFFKKLKESKYDFTFSEKELESFISKNIDSFPYSAGDVETWIDFIKRKHAISLFGRGLEKRKKISMEDLQGGFSEYKKNKNNPKKDYTSLSMYA
jgi:hypothetical protein